MTKTFDLRINIAPRQEAKSLSFVEKEALFKKPDLTDKKAKTAGAVPRAVLVDPEPEPLSLSLEDISTGYSELIVKANSLLALLQERVGDMTYEFDPAKNPILSEAIAETFQGEYKRITYNMYLQALRLDKDLAVAIGEQSHGLR